MKKSEGFQPSGYYFFMANLLSRRRIFLINPKFQVRFSIYVCSWLACLSLAYPLIIFNLFNFFIDYLVGDPMGPALEILERTRRDLLFLLILMQVVFLSLAFGISIFMSHRIVGPLYKLKQFLIDARDGNLNQHLLFRKKDYFTEIAPAYNEMMATIRERIGSKNKAVESAVKRLEMLVQNTSPETSQGLQEIIHSLKEISKDGVAR